MEEQETLRDVIAEQVGKLDTEPPVEPAVSETPVEKPVEEPKETRARDDQGRFVEKPKESLKESPVPTERDKMIAAGVIKPAVQPQVSIPRPSSWKKDYWDAWDKMVKENPSLAGYLNQRESEYAKGVSAYKAEFDRARPLSDAVNQFSREIQAMKTTPEQFITNLGNAHKTLALGTPEQKLSMFLKIANDYQVPVQNLFTRGQDGQVYFNPQIQPYQAQQQQPDVRQTVQEILMQEKAQQELTSFESQLEKYPHYEVVKETMAQLLDSGFSKTLESAYETALRLPQHSDLYEQAQQAKLEEEKKQAAEKAKAEVERARRSAVSTRSSTPAVKSGEGKPRSIREDVETAFDAHIQGDRV